MKKYRTIAALFLCMLTAAQLLEACHKTDRAYTATVVPFTVPAGFPQPQYNFAANPLTKEGIELGRHLFYEGKLSKDGNFPCASCHQQVAAFGTFDHDRSHGYNNAHTMRNAPPLFNLAWQNEFGLDGRIKTLEQQSLSHITSITEMGENMDAVVAKLKSSGQYRQLFSAAYGDANVNSTRILNALSQFLLTMVSADSKYDKVKRGEATFEVYEQRGYALYQAKCASCHKEPLFTDLTYRNIGLPVDPTVNDFGRMLVTKNPADSLKFKVPTLRNTAFSYPFMHSGHFPYVENVLLHYGSGVQKSSTLDPAMENGIPLTRAEVLDLTAFIKTLSDSAFIKNTQFSKP